METTNIIIKNKTKYKYESFWRKSDTEVRDSEGKLFPVPHEGRVWSDEEQFVKKLIGVQNYLKTRNNYELYKEKEVNNNCLLCGEKNVLNGYFTLHTQRWQDSLVHYITVHHTKPSENFIDAIYRFMPIRRSKRVIKFDSDVYSQDSIQYLKVDKNQLMIIDALMKHGGYTKKYIDKNGKNAYRYSEHAGLLDFNETGLDKLIISAKTSRVDKGDEEIYLPKDMPYALDYEYIFHTHPPTPKPGGRASIGILYEFPSISDIFHFIDHYNYGTTQGSLVITPEGLYNIRKTIPDNKKIKVDENKLYREMNKIMRITQEEAIDKYGIDFTTYEFYSKIAQDTQFIKNINNVLNKYLISIDFYPRLKDHKGNWIIDSIHLPVFVTNALDKNIKRKNKK